MFLRRYSKLGEEILTHLDPSAVEVPLHYNQIIIDYIPMKYQHKIKDQNSFKKSEKVGVPVAMGYTPNVAIKNRKSDD